MTSMSAARWGAGELARLVLRDGNGELEPELLPGVVDPSDPGVGHWPSLDAGRMAASEKPALEP